MLSQLVHDARWKNCAQDDHGPVASTGSLCLSKTLSLALDFPVSLDLFDLRLHEVLAESEIRDSDFGSRFHIVRATQVSPTTTSAIHIAAAEPARAIAPVDRGGASSAIDPIIMRSEYVLSICNHEWVVSRCNEN